MVKTDITETEKSKENRIHKISKKKRLRCAIVIIVIIIVYIVAGLCDTRLVVTNYVYKSSRLPKEFDGYKIVLVSDLHHKKFGDNQTELLDKIRAAKPDMIALTGDIVDKRHDDMKSIKDFIEGISTIAPAYYVTGNHELDSAARSQYESLRTLFSEYGIIELDDKILEIKGREDSIFITGVRYSGDWIESRMTTADESKFNILLYHGSDVFDKLSRYGYDVILSGHTHGGIVRLPFVGGVFGNDRSLFPKYAGGRFEKHGSTMFASRGLGDAVIPRFYNPPELVVVTLRCN